MLFSRREIMGGQVAGLNPVADIRGYYQAMVSRNLGPTAKPKAIGDIIIKVCEFMLA